MPGRPDRRLANLMGAFGLAIADLLVEGAESHGHNEREEAALVLGYLVEGLSQEDLRRRLGLSQPGVARLVDRLCHQGLMERGAGPDARTHALRVTREGAAEAEAALGRRHQAIGPLVRGLSVAQRRALTEMLEAMLSALVGAGRSPWRMCRLCDQDSCSSARAGCPVEEEMLRQSSGRR